MNKKNILHYLSIKGETDLYTNQLIDECIEEVKALSLFKCIHKQMTLSHSPLKIEEMDMLLESKDLEVYLEGCQQCIIIACTLGAEVDRKLRYYQYSSMSKAVIFDAVCNAYLEECCDEYEKSLGLNQRTFRLCPGYGNIPINYNNSFSKVLNIEKELMVTIYRDGLMVPMKSMIGIIGIGNQKKKSCLSCINIHNCKLRKEGLTCYVKD